MAAPYEAHARTGGHEGLHVAESHVLTPMQRGGL